MPTQPLNPSREMTLYPMRCVSYLIGVYLTGTTHPSPITIYPSPITIYHLTKLCKTNPICWMPK
jgi:hypothetical protein